MCREDGWSWEITNGRGHLERERDREVERERKSAKERENSWMREREYKKEAELGTTLPESSPAKMARLWWLGEEEREGERNLLSPLLTGHARQVKAINFFFENFRVKYPSCPSFIKEKYPICPS